MTYKEKWEMHKITKVPSTSFEAAATKGLLISIFSTSEEGFRILLLNMKNHNIPTTTRIANIIPTMAPALILDFPPSESESEFP